VALARALYAPPPCTYLMCGRRAEVLWSVVAGTTRSDQAGALVNSEPALRWSVALYSCSVVVPWGAGESVVADVASVSHHQLTMLLVGGVLNFLQAINLLQPIYGVGAT
jgi:hypothetical protein